VQVLGNSYKWLLYGDDDTLFFPDAVLDLLEPFDHDLPYAITDNVWFEADVTARPPYRHPALDAPRCLPCHFLVDADIVRTFTGAALVHPCRVCNVMSLTRCSRRTDMPR
jgi:hypothetical protein